MREKIKQTKMLVGLIDLDNQFDCFLFSHILSMSNIRIIIETVWHHP
jgi:hypothetical protein